MSVHAKKTGAPLVVRETRTEPLRIEEWQTSLDKKKFGPLYRKDAKAVESAVETLTQDMLEKLAISLQSDGKISLDVNGVGKVEITKDLINIERRTRVENVREFTPNIIEPSFGIGRILYALCEHSYWTRAEDEARGVSRMPRLVHLEQVWSDHNLGFILPAHSRSNEGPSCTAFFSRRLRSSRAPSQSQAAKTRHLKPRRRQLC